MTPMNSVNLDPNHGNKVNGTEKKTSIVIKTKNIQDPINNKNYMIKMEEERGRNRRFNYERKKA